MKRALVSAGVLGMALCVYAAIAPSPLGSIAQAEGVTPEPQVIIVTTTEPEVNRDDYGVTVTTMEDDPGWDCATMGNRVCGPASEPTPITSGTIWPCLLWDGTHDEHVIPPQVRDDVCLTPEGNYSHAF